MDPKDSVDQVPFSTISQLFQELRQIRHGKRNRSALGAKKREVLWDCWRSIAEQTAHGRHILAKRKSEDAIVPAYFLRPDEAFKIVSLLVPALDTEHSTMGLKESKLADTFIAALNLAKQSDEALWLKNYKDKQFRPEELKLAEDIVEGSFPSVLKAVLQKRCDTKSSLTIGDVWNALDTLSEVSSSKYHRFHRPSYQTTNIGTTINVVGERTTKHHPARRIQTLRKVIQSGTAVDVSEIARIVLKENEISVSLDWFLNWFHPGAKQYYNQTHDLRKLLSDCHDPEFKIGGITVQVGRYASVMLTQRPSRKNLKSICAGLCGIGDGKGTCADSSNESMMMATQSNTQFFEMEEKQAPKYFIVEPKLDGERMQLHLTKNYDENGRCKSVDIETFTRNGLSSSDMYADALREVIQKNIRADKAILDGEIMIWDLLRESWISFSRFREVSTNISRGDIPEGCSYMLKFMIFDVLLVDQSISRKSLSNSSQNSRKVIRLPLYKRREILSQIVRPAVTDVLPGLKSAIELVETNRSRTEHELLAALQKLCSQGFEGVIAKHPDQPYILAERRPDVGIKLKPDYFDGGLQDLDVLILGARFSTSVKRVGRIGDISTFLIGVRDDKFSTLNDAKWIPVGSVGSGYTDVELERIRYQLEGQWEDFDPKHLPSHFTQRAYSGSIFRECSKWIAPSKSLILTVRAYELSMSYLALRFPRVERINWSKPPSEAVKLTELIELNEEKTPAYIRADEKDVDDIDARAESYGGPRKKPKTGVEDAAIARARAEGVRITEGVSASRIISSARGANVSKVKIVANAFAGLVFHVLISDEELKNEMEVKIHELGGKFIQNLTLDVDFVISVEADGDNLEKLLLKFQSTENDSDTCPIVKSSWLRRCRAKKSKDDIQWKDVLFATHELKKDLLKFADRYGDPWEKETTVDGLIQCVEKIDSLRKAGTLSNILDIDPTVMKLVNGALKKSGAVFQDRRFYIVEGLELYPRGVGSIIQSLGGKIISSIELDEEVCAVVHDKCVSEWIERKHLQIEPLNRCVAVTSEQVFAIADEGIADPECALVPPSWWPSIKF